MPHIIINIAQGNCRNKMDLAQKIHDLVESQLQIQGGDISVSVKEIPRDEWMQFISTIPKSEMVIEPKYSIK